MSGDDLHNEWGTNLVVLSKTERKLHNSQSTVNQQDEFKRIVSHSFRNKFHLQGVVANGSSANIFAMVDSTEGDTGRCLVAVGSYLCASNSYLCNLATSEFKLNSPLSLIREPSDHDSLFARTHIIALPYHIEGAINGAELEKYEDICLFKLHEKLLLYRIIERGKPIMTLFLELVLAGNGASLSDRSLSKIATLSKRHDFKIIVDEIMTGGRTGTILLLQTKSDDFIKRVSHVTLGKWCQCGIILVSSERNNIEQKQKYDATSPQSNSTGIDLSPVIPLWNKLLTILPMAEIRRDMVLSKTKCHIDEAWGSGALIFSPIKNNTMNGLNHRLLPLLELSSISGNISKPFNKIGSTFRDGINLNIMDTVTNWNEVPIHDKSTIKSVTGYLLIIKYLIIISNLSGETEVVLSTEEIYEALGGEIKMTKLGSMLGDMREVGLLDYKQVGKKRLRNWVISKFFLYV
jgi:hypothetical protein